jgi:hypothetical protein
MNMHTLYDAEARMDDFRRQAEHARLVNKALAHHESSSLLKWGQQMIGRSLVALRSRQDQPVGEPIRPAVVDGTALALNECCA